MPLSPGWQAAASGNGGGHASGKLTALFMSEEFRQLLAIK